MSQAIYVGIDISAASLAVNWQTPSGDVLTWEGQQKLGDWRKLKKQLVASAGEAEIIVVLEATSTYWLGVAYYLHEAGCTIKAVNPAQAHYFMNSYLQRDKTDQMDAQLLAQMARERHASLATWTPPPVVYEELYQRLILREALMGTRQSLRSQYHALRQRPQPVPEVLATYEALIADLEAQIKALEKTIKHALTAESEWQATAQHLLSIPGVGPLTVAWLLVTTQNFTTCETPEQLASYIGLVPREYRSGTSVYRRPSIGRSARPRLRSLLYLVAWSATRYNPVMKSYYERLLARGKAKQVALIATARKLVHVMFALAKKGEDFNPNLGGSTN